MSTYVGGDRDSSSYKHDIEIAANPAYATVIGDRDTGGSSSKDVDDNLAYEAVGSDRHTVLTPPHSSDYGTHAHYCYARAAVIINEVRRGVVCQKSDFSTWEGLALHFSLWLILPSSEPHRPQTSPDLRGAELKIITISLRCP